MSIPVIVTGDDVALLVTLYKNSNVFSIDAGAAVKASLIIPDRSAVLIPEVVCSNATAGADWANSLVVVEFTSVESTITHSGDALVEIQVDDGGKLTFFASVLVALGTIT